MTSKKINCLAVDDEPLALSVLQKYIESVPAFQLVATCANAIEAFQKLHEAPVDLIFLDIQMPGIMGTDFIRTLKKAPKIIFTTAYRKYAVEGFELDAVDYLLKPISFERFLKAVNKVLQIEINAPDADFNPVAANLESANTFIYARADRKMVKIILQEVLYIEGLGDYVKIVTPTKAIVTKQLLSSLEETLSKASFMRIHRSFIVAIDKIDSYDADCVQIGKNDLPIGRFYKREVDKILNALAISSNRQPAEIAKGNNHAQKKTDPQ